MKKDALLECQEETKKYKNAFESNYEKIVKINSELSGENIDSIKKFVSSDNKEIKKELNEILNENGSNEKNPFDIDVIAHSVNISCDIFKREFEIYLNAYDKTQKLFNEINSDDVKLEKHKKFINDSKAKLHFLFAEKEYIIQFLDNERIAAIYGKKVHRKLMLEACRNLTGDLHHIDNLYEIILKEAAGRTSKRLYKDNYNINYLDEIEKNAENIEKENDKLKENAAVVINLNYWRIEGIGRIQETFENDVAEIYGRDLSEIFPQKFVTEEAPEVVEQAPILEVEEINEVQEVKEVSKVLSKSKYTRLKSSKVALANALYKLSMVEVDANEYEEVENDIEEESTIVLSWKNEEDSNDELEKVDIIERIESEPEIIGEKSEETLGLYEKIASLDELDDENFTNINISLDNANSENNVESAKETEDAVSNDEEDSIIEWYFKGQDKDQNIKSDAIKKQYSEGNKKVGIFKKLIGMNAKSKREA